MVTKDDLLSVAVLRLGFEYEPYKTNLDSFISYINEGKDADAKKMMHYLISLAVDFCGISKTYRTIAFDLAWSYLQTQPAFWTPEEIEEGMSRLDDHWLEFYPEDDGTFAKYDVIVLNFAEYFVHAMNMLIKDYVADDKKAMFSYAAYSFFKTREFDDSEDELKEYLKDMLVQEDEDDE